METMETVSTAISLSTYVTETQSTETLSVTNSATDMATTTGIESATASTTAVETSLTDTSTIAVTTTTETTTADTTTTSTATTTIAVPEEQDPEPRGACVDLNQPYKARNGATFNITCGREMFFSTLVDTIFTNTFSDCADACAEDDACTGVSFTKSDRRCELFADPYQNVQNADKDIATLRERPE